MQLTRFKIYNIPLGDKSIAEGKVCFNTSMCLEAPTDILWNFPLQRGGITGVNHILGIGGQVVSIVIQQALPLRSIGRGLCLQQRFHAGEYSLAFALPGRLPEQATSR